MDIEALVMFQEYIFELMACQKEWTNVVAQFFVWGDVCKYSIINDAKTDDLECRPASTSNSESGCITKLTRRGSGRAWNQILHLSSSGSFGKQVKVLK